MATEILNLEVKSNIKGAVTDVDALRASVEKAYSAEAELNKNIELSTEFLAAQQTELIRLKEIQDAIPKGAWFAGQTQLADKIRTVTSEIRSEKDALKNLKREQKDVAKAIRDKTSAQKKDTNAALRGIQHFSIMGVSLRSLKNMVRGIIPMFRLLFTTIKVGIASTGVGLLVLAIAALVVSMKNTIAGGKAFKSMMEGIGEVTGAISDALEDVGDLMLSVFGFDSSIAVTAAERLTEAYQRLSRQLGFLSVQESESRIQSKLNKIIIDDETKSEKERLAAATDNFVITSVFNKKKKEAIEAQLELDKEAERQNNRNMALEDKNTEDGRANIDLLIEKNTELVNKKYKTLQALSDIEVKEFDDEKAFFDLKIQIRQFNIDAEDKLRQEKIDKDNIAKQKKLEDDAYWDAKILANDIWNMEQQEIIRQKAKDDEIQDAKEIADAKIAYQNAIVASTTASLRALSSLAKEGSAASKVLALSEIAINTGVGFMQGLVIAQKASKSLPGPAAALAFPIFYASQVAAVLGAAAQAKAALTGGGGGGSTPSMTSPSSAPPSPQMMSGAFELTGGQAVEPTRAYVVSDDITNSQNALAIIRRRATI